MIRQEQVRLEALEERARSGDSEDPGKLQKRLHALERMRERLSAVSGG